MKARHFPFILWALGAFLANAGKAHAQSAGHQLPTVCQAMHQRALESMGLAADGVQDMGRSCSQVFRSCEWPRQIIGASQDYGDKLVKSVRLYHERYQWFETLELDETEKVDGPFLSFKLVQNKVHWGMSIEFGKEGCQDPFIHCYGPGIGRDCSVELSAQGCAKGTGPSGMSAEMLRHACYVIHGIRLPSPPIPKAEPIPVPSPSADCPALAYLMDGVGPISEARKTYLQGLAQALDGGDAEARNLAVSHSGKTLEELEDLLKILRRDRRDGLRLDALEQLAQVGGVWGHPSMRKKAREAFLGLENESLPPELKSKWLERIGDLAAQGEGAEFRARCEKIVRANLESTDVVSRRIAVQGLVKIALESPTAKRRDEIAKLITTSRDPDYIEGAVRALVPMKNSRDPEVRQWLGAVLGALKLPSDTEIDTFWLDTILNDLKRPR